MENIAFVDIFTTQNDLYGRNNCPMQFSCEIFSNEEVFDEDVFLKNKATRQKYVNIIPDEHIMPLGTVISGFRDADVTTPSYDGKGLADALEGIYGLLSILRDRNVFIAGFNHAAYDLRILNESFKRVLGKVPIEFPSRRILDIFRICENTIEVTEIGSYSMDSVFEYLFGNVEDLKRIRSVKSTLTDILLTKMMLRKLMKDNESFSGFLERTQPKRCIRVFNFGKYKGAAISEIIKKDQQYVSWILNNKTMREQNPTLIDSLNSIMSKGVVPAV